MSYRNSMRSRLCATDAQTHLCNISWHRVCFEATGIRQDCKWHGTPASADHTAPTPIVSNSRSSQFLRNMKHEQHWAIFGSMGACVRHGRYSTKGLTADGSGMLLHTQSLWFHGCSISQASYSLMLAHPEHAHISRPLWCNIPSVI